MDGQGQKIYCIGWGSLMKEEGTLRESLVGEWSSGGPKLPIGITRKSQGRKALTRVLDCKASLEKTMVCRFGPYIGLNNAIKALREREGISEQKKEYIGYINFRTRAYRCSNQAVYEKILEWGTRLGIDGVVWTELPSNIDFENEYQTLPAGFRKRSNVIERMLRNDATLLRNTKTYIRLIPEEMRSALEKRILEM